MTISAKIIADSVSPEGYRLTTMQLRYPRFVHAEFMTHRVFSRNASSSRAIPVERLIQDIIDDTAMPIHWGKNQKGMQAHEELGPIERARARGVWRRARNRAIEQAQKMIEIGAHKQIVNRLLEPFSHINVLVTATEWTNFFGLRDHPDAQPEIRVLAQCMKAEMATSTPKLLKPGEWHLPYVTEDDVVDCGVKNLQKCGGFVVECDGSDLVKISVSRCARVSYLTHEGKRPSIKEDLELYDRLIGSKPLHASPAEHQATPDQYNEPEKPRTGWEQPEQHGNLVGWIQYRKTLPGECIGEARS